MNWDWNQYKAAGKHAASYIAGGVSMAVAFHFIGAGQGADITKDVGQITDGIEKITAGIAGLIAVATPIYTMLRAATNASTQHQAASLVATANTGTPEQAKAAQVAIASAVIDTNDLMLKGTIAAPREVADAIPSEKVQPK